MQIKEAIIKPVFLYPDDDIKTVKKKLQKKDNNICIVINKNKKFLGEVHEQDLLKLFIPQDMLDEQDIIDTLGVGYDKNFFAKRAKDLMKKHPFTISLDANIKDIIFLMFKQQIQYLPVIDKKEKVIGVITLDSLLNALEYGK